MKPRILAVDDETKWLDNFRVWVPESIAVQDSATTTQEAISFLRKYCYDVVILDLSMDTSNRFNRGNRIIQEYLASKPDGTHHIVVSANADSNDVAEAAYRYGAISVIFKPYIEPTVLKDKVMQAIENAFRQKGHLTANCWLKLTDDFNLKNRILTTLTPKDGQQGLNHMIDVLFHQISPIAPHKDRPRLEIWNNCVVGLVWSRQLGRAVSVVIANTDIPEEEAKQRLDNWLGYESLTEPFSHRAGHRIHLQVFEQPNISDTHFDLPSIPMPTA